jgi:hypothetical protein
VGRVSKYSEEFRRQAAMLVVDARGPVREVAPELDANSQPPQTSGAQRPRVEPMAGKRVRYSAPYESLHVEGTGDVLLMDSDHAFGPLEILGPASLSSLKAAMTAVYEEYPFGSEDGPLADLPRFSVNWSLDSAAEFNDDLSMQEPVNLALMRDGSLLVELNWSVGPPPRTEEDTWPEGAALLDSWLQPRGGRLVKFTPGDMGFRWYWTIYFSIPLRGRTVADTHAIGTDAISLLETHDQGAATIESLTALLRSGHAGALVGMPEGQLLEAKRHIHLEDEKGRLEFGKDVSAIANSPVGGLIVVGLGTKREAGRDVVADVHPFPNTGQVPRVRSLLDRIVYPPIQGLDVSLVSAGSSHPADEHLLVITVPPQPRELTPFLVTGVVVDGRVQGNYVGIFERRGEDVVPSGAASIHAGLSVGLALLRGRPVEITQAPAQPE